MQTTQTSEYESAKCRRESAQTVCSMGDGKSCKSKCVGGITEEQASEGLSFAQPMNSSAPILPDAVLPPDTVYVTVDNGVNPAVVGNDYSLMTALRPHVH